MPVVEENPRSELPYKYGIGRSATAPTPTGRTECIRLSYMSGGRESQSLIHLRLTKAFARCSGVHLQRFYCVPCACIEPTGSSLKDPEPLKKIESEETQILQSIAQVELVEVCVLFD